jgi:hypothetical protein
LTLRQGRNGSLVAIGNVCETRLIDCGLHYYPVHNISFNKYTEPAARTFCVPMCELL